MLTIIACSIGLLFIGCITKALWVHKKKLPPASMLDQDITKLFVFSGIYLSGYLLLFIEDRYLWIIIMTGLLGLGYLGELLAPEQKRIKQSQFFWPVGLLLFLLISFLVYQLHWRHFFHAARENSRIGQAEYSFGKTLGAAKPYEKRMVHWPDKEDNSLYVSWFTAYFAEGRHYNCLPREINMANALIGKNEISIVFVSDTAIVGAGYVFTKWKKIVGPIPDTDVYIKP